MNEKGRKLLKVLLKRYFKRKILTACFKSPNLYQVQVYTCRTTQDI